MISFLRRSAGMLMCALGTVSLAGQAAALDYPTRPIRLIVPWGSGTPGDVAGRATAERMAPFLGQPIAVENKPGASGTIGLQEVLRQPADGYTLYLLGSPGTLVAPLLYPNQRIELDKNLMPVGLVAWSYNVLVTVPNSPLSSVSDVVAGARAKPGELNFASGGHGTPAHLAGSILAQQSGTSMVHVPYNQFPQAIVDLVSGRIDFMFLTASAAIPQIAGGKLKAIAVTGKSRLAALPNVPTMAEQGYPGFVFRGFEMLTARQGTPREVVDKLVAALAHAQASPDLKTRLDGMALEIESMSPATAAATLVSEQESILGLARSIGLKAE